MTGKNAPIRQMTGVHFGPLRDTLKKRCLYGKEWTNEVL
jgi:hypothetical protein